MNEELCSKCRNVVIKEGYGYGDRVFCDNNCKHRYLQDRARSMVTDEQKQFIDEINSLTKEDN